MEAQNIPTDRPLERHELEQFVSKAILKGIEREGRGYVQLEEFAAPHNLGRILGLTGESVQEFKKFNATPEYLKWYNEFVHKLITLGILVQTWDQGHAHIFTTYERGRSILTDITELPYAEAVQFVEALVDDELRARCSDVLLRTRHTDSMVRDATVVLEDRLKERISADPTTYGQELVNQALRPNDGKLVLGDTPSEQASIHRLFQGVLGFFGNPTHHRLIRDLPAIRARQVIGMIDTLLVLLTEAKDRT